MTVDTTHNQLTPAHLEREAWIYIRQSTLRQLQENTQSTHRQYALKQRALALGWSPDRIRIVDQDQGTSGASLEYRNGFRELMGKVACGEAGAVISLEMSRLARDNADWHQLLRIAGYSNTLIIDETSIYDPANSNDRLLLGIKGTISEFELLGIRERMLGGLKNAARRGELKLNLPIGLMYDDQQQVVLDPDRSIVDAIAGVFASYRRLGSISMVVGWMHRQQLLFPTRPSRANHPAGGTLRWSLPSFSQIRAVLLNPRYAGAYVYGQRRMERRPDGTGYSRVLDLDEWEVCIQNAHVGYLEWDEYLQNRQSLRADRAKRVPTPRPPREGAALFQNSQLLCGHCGYTMGVRYKCISNPQSAAYYYACCSPRDANTGFRCPQIRGDRVDAAIGEFVIALLNRDQIELALAVERQVREEFAQADAQRAQHIERLRYEERRAQQRYMAADPEHRLVVTTLEADWNRSLESLQRATAQRDHYAQQMTQELSDVHSTRIVAACRDFAQVWHDPKTRPQQRKQLLALLLEDVTLRREDNQAIAQLRLKGGKTVTLDPITLPPRYNVERKTPTHTIERIAHHALTLVDSDIARKLNEEGCNTWNREPYTAQKVCALRKQYSIAGFIEAERQKLQHAGYVPASEIAEQLGIGCSLVYAWGQSPHRPWLQMTSFETLNGKRFQMFKIDAETCPKSISKPNSKTTSSNLNLSK